MFTGFTLDDFSDIMHYDAAAFMGVRRVNSCAPLDCRKRNMYVRAAETALQLIEGQLRRYGLRLYDTADEVVATAPYFRMESHTPKVLDSEVYTGSVFAPTDPDDMATVLVDVGSIPDGHSYYGHALDFGACVCKRLPVKACSESYDPDTGILTITARAYNFVDLDSIGASSVPADSVPYLASVEVTVYTVADAVPTAHWPADPCSCVTDGSTCCDTTPTTGCLRQDTHDVYRVLDYFGDCLYQSGRPIKFVMDVMLAGAWRPEWADAVVSLMNTRLPANYCDCDPLTNLRWADDNGTSERYSKAYPHSFWNPFGISAPGAQFAWKTIEASISGTVVFR